MWEWVALHDFCALWWNLLTPLHWIPHWLPRWTPFAGWLLTLLLQGKLPCVKDQVGGSMCQGNCYGFNKLSMRVRSNWHKYPHYGMWLMLGPGLYLASKRIQMLLHCVGMARAEGDQTIGQEEYEVQFQKYSSGKQINALAKNIARAIVFMGLEPFQGATAMPLGADDIQRPMQHWTQSFATRGLFLHVHFDVQYFGFDSACFLGMGVQTGKWRLHKLWTSLHAICYPGISCVYSSAEDGASWNRPETPTLRAHGTFWRDWDGLR